MAKKRGKKIRIDERKAKSYKKDFEAALREVIRVKQREFDGHKLQVRTGNLKDRIKADISVENGELLITFDVMNYYKFLDEGTRYIHKWELTEALYDSAKLNNILGKLLESSIENNFDISFNYIEREVE